MPFLVRRVPPNRLGIALRARECMVRNSRTSALASPKFSSKEGLKKVFFSEILHGIEHIDVSSSSLRFQSYKNLENLKWDCPLGHFDFRLRLPSVSSLIHYSRIVMPKSLGLLFKLQHPLSSFHLIPQIEISKELWTFPGMLHLFNVQKWTNLPG